MYVVVYKGRQQVKEASISSKWNGSENRHNPRMNLYLNE